MVISVVKPTRCTNESNLFYFRTTLYVSCGLSVQRHEFKSVHATGNCQTDTAVCLLAGTKWFYCRNDITMHGPMNVKSRTVLGLQRYMSDVYRNIVFKYNCCYTR